MKNLSKLGMLLILTLTLTSCQKIKSWFDVEFDTTLSGVLYIDVIEPVTKAALRAHFHEEITVDPMDDSDVAEYDENITRIEATNIIATVTSVSGGDGGDVIFEQGTYIRISGSEVVNWPLQESWTLQVGDQLILGGNVSDSDYQAITTMLTNRESLTVIADGYCNQTNVYITLNVDIDISVTANPL